MTKSAPARSRKKPTANNDLTCEFCGRQFRQDNTLLLHVCEQKRRYVQRDEKPVKLGYMAYEQFYQHSMHKAAPSASQFAGSNLYLAFVRFGRHLVDLNAINPRGFIDFLLRIAAPIDKWTNPTLYTTYIRELNKNETPMDALERNFVLMQQWATDTGQEWREFFRKIDGPLAVLWIISGRISPWLLFIAASAVDLMQRLQPDQLTLIDRSIDPEFWRLKIERHQRDVDIIREVLAEQGI